MHRTILIAVLLTAAAANAQFSDTGQVNIEIDRTDPGIAAWAVEVVDWWAGPQDYRDPALGDAAYGLPGDVLGDTAAPFSLGDGGWITVRLEVPAVDGPGPDLVVFENGFAWNGVYMELGFVEVSSDGVTFSRLPALCRRTTQPGAWDTSSPTDFYNLAGNFVGGTGFDLADLLHAFDPAVLSGAVDINAITHVRIVDVVGDVTGPGGSTDHLGRPVADPFPTASASCGMDLTAVGVLNAVGSVGNRDLTWSGVKDLFR